MLQFNGARIPIVVYSIFWKILGRIPNFV